MRPSTGGTGVPSAPAICPRGWRSVSTACSKKIGEGGMGSVYAAIQPVIGKRVAIKVLAQHIASNPELVRRFVDEARAVNQIGHPNIVDIFSFGWLPDKRHYFAMEFLDGQSLADRMKRGPFPPDEARRLLRQICQALEAAHRQGIVHRDLKPDNICIVQPQHGDSYAKLLDFGIAKLVGDADEGQRTQTGIVMGTPAYMSPEQCRGVNVGLGTDIYALGMILYEMFAGKLPFQGSFAELITHHLMTVPEAPSRHRPMPRALEQLIMRCVDKDPAQRPQTAEELGKALEAALSTAGDDAPDGRGGPRAVQQPQQPRPPAPQRRRRRRWIRSHRPLAGPRAIRRSSRPAIGGRWCWARRGGGHHRGHRGVPAGRPPRRRRQGLAGAGGRCPGAARGRLAREAAAGARARGRERGRRGARAGRRQAGGGRGARGPGPRSGAGRVARAARRGRRPEAARAAVHGRLGHGGGAGSVALRRGSPPSRRCRRSTGNGATAPPSRSRRPSGAGQAGQPATPPPATSKPRHRDSLVGDDIFGGK